MVDPANPKLEPSAVETKSFTTKVRGFDPTEVRQYLASIASALREQQRSASAVAASSSTNDAELKSLQAQLDAATKERDDVKASLAAAASKKEAASRESTQTVPNESLADLDDDRLTELLGEETARVLQSARIAAGEIRGKADAEVAERRSALEIEEQEHRERLAAQAKEQSEALAAAKQEADASAEASVSNAKTEAAALVAAATAEAATQRDTAAADAETARTEAAAEIETNRAASEEVAAALKTRAEEVADEIRQSAEEEANLVREGAASGKADAEAEAARIRAEAEADSTTSRDAAREEARLMLTEAQALREKVLSDLVEKRQVGRNQLDQTKAARDRLARSLGTVKRELDEAIAELTAAVPEAKRALEGRLPPAEVAPDKAAAALAVELDTARNDGEEVSEDDLFERIRADRGEDEEPLADAAGEDAADPTEVADDGDDAVSEVVSEVSSEVDIELSPPFVARDIAMTRFGPDFRRQFKRALADDQSDVLDRLRRARKSPSVDQLPEVRAALLPYLDALTPALTSIADAGAVHGGGTSAPSEKIDELVDRTARALVEPMRTRVEASVNAADDADDVIEPIRAHYREFRTSILPELADDALAEAFAMGLYEAIPKGTKLEWLADPRNEINADCYDTSGKMSKKSSNGKTRPVCAPGCRCLAAPAN